MDKTKWRKFRCGSCRGYGIVMVYAHDGPDHTDDCRYCNMGTVYISENDRLAEWPGGPFLGSWPGKYKEIDD